MMAHAGFASTLFKMKLLFVFAFLSDPFPVAALLKGRQYVACAADNCLKAVNVTSGGYGPDGTADCRGYMTSTAVVNPILRTATITTVSTVTVIPPCPVFPTQTTPAGIYARQPEAAGPWGYGPPRGYGPPAREDITTAPSVATRTGPIPQYVSSVCRSDHYSSACRCIGVTPGQITTTGLTLEATITVTQVETSLAPCTTPVLTSVIKLTYSDKTSTTTISVYDPISSGTGTGTGTGSYYLPPPIPSSSSSSKTPSYSYLPPPPPPYGNTTTSSTSYSYAPPYTNRTTSSYGGIPTSDTTAPPSNSTLPPTNTYTNATIPPTTFPPSNTTLPPGNSTLPPTDPTAPPTNITLPPFPIPTNSTLPPFPTSPTNATLPPFPIPTNSTLPLLPTSPQTNTSFPLLPTSPPNNTILPPFPTSSPPNITLPPFPTSPPPNSTFLPPTNTSLSPTGTGTPLCGGRGVRLCSNVCTDTTTSTAHCGACGNACLDGYLCTNGVCTRPACDSDCRFSRLCGASSANTTCACGTDTSGAGVCYNRGFDCRLSTPPRCDRTAQCAVGSVCVRNACCGARGGRCVSTEGCGIRGAGFVLGERVAFDGFTGDGDGEDNGLEGRSVMLF
ncbi:hypothetical protein DM02DRAFT_202211 [Periconia macrospinosa]|uniref:Uncharacterized protein n=1 Tax=Periconia macrospinosa TaxID=97972 RepID=A0A2V1E1X7_9PLEO|nr:hypothetical protein DM02DRAFT_202211 [Periconia macrospinosa]